MEKWTQDEAIAFECACECITDLMAIYTGQIADEKCKDAPDAEKMAGMRAVRTKLAQERAALRLADHANIARIRTEYGAVIRAWRAQYNPITA